LSALCRATAPPEPLQAGDAPKQITAKRGKMSNQLVDFYPFLSGWRSTSHLPAYIALA